MLRRLYLDNFKSLVNFDLELGRTHLLLGRNGSGKSAVFAALSQLKKFIQGGGAELFSRATCTRWERRTRQTFELEVELKEHGIARYRLEFDHGARPFVGHESLHVAGKPLFIRVEDSVRTFEEDGGERPGELLIPSNAAALQLLDRRLARAHLKPWLRFCKWLGRLQVASIIPSKVGSKSSEESRILAEDLGNFASWYRDLAQEQPDAIRSLEDDLRQVLGPEFQHLRLARTGSESDRELRTEWRVDASSRESQFELGFDELSDGQRALICLYALLHAAGEWPTLLCIDEPDNFVALSEIQPWLNALSERPNLQALLISHHPEIINPNAEDALYFYRRGQGPTRVRKFQELVHPDEPLTAAELVARGWIDADS